MEVNGNTKIKDKLNPNYFKLEFEAPIFPTSKEHTHKKLKTV